MHTIVLSFEYYLYEEGNFMNFFDGPQLKSTKFSLCGSLLKREEQTPYAASQKPSAKKLKIKIQQYINLVE